MKRNKAVLMLLIFIITVSVVACGSTLAQPALQDAPGEAETVSASEVRLAEATPADAQAQPQEERLRVRFSHSAGFYSEAFELELTAPEGATIYYTTNGAVPTTSSTRYTKPIAVTVPRAGVVNVLSIRAIAVQGRQTSEVATRSFVKGRDVATRFGGETLVFVLNSDPRGLYDHHNGIMVEGIDRERWREEFRREHGHDAVVGWSQGEENPGVPANFNRRGRESERPAHVQMFDAGGRMHISQNIGIRVRGGYSRAQNQVSLELFAREDYDDRSNLLFPFFGQELAPDGQLINRYRRVRLRNGGSDRIAGFVRDELSHTLFRQAGHTETQSHVPAAVFLNGEYYGVAWLKSPRTPNHLSRLYGGRSGGFEIVAGGDQRFSDPWWMGEKRATDDLMEVFKLATQGFAGAGGDAKYTEFARRVDVDALIRYYAMQIYINNLDWPNHNIEMWRYFPTEAEKNDPDLHPYLRDGRWRFFAHDIESAWSIWDDEGRMAKEDTLKDVLTGENPTRWNSSQSSAFLYAVVSRADTKAQLANTFADLVDGPFAPANVNKVLDDLVAQISKEHEYALKANILNPESPYWPDINYVNHSRDTIRDFAKERPAVINKSVNDNLGFNRARMYAVSLTTGAGGGATLNSRPVNESQTLTANYYANTSVKITAHPYPGFVVDAWSVNGDRQTGNAVTVSEKADVTLTFKRCPDFLASGHLQITAIKSGDQGFIELKNHTNRALSTAGLYLSDSNSNLQKWPMPDLTVPPNGTLLINTLDNSQPADRPQANFNLSLGERLRLSDAQGNVLDLVEVSLVYAGDVQRRGNDGKWRVEG
jgi:hypothetical protein